MKPILTTIGSATRDIFLVPNEDTIEYYMDDDNIKSREKICFELGAKLEANYLSSHVGGTAVNVSIGLSRLGITSAARVSVGKDGFGKAVIKKLQKEKVSTSLVKMAKNTQTDRSLIIIHPETKERTIFVNKVARKGTKIDYSKIDSKYIYLSSIKYNWENTFKEILRVVKNKNIKLFFTPGIKQVQAGLNKLKNFLNYVQIIFLNFDEAIELSRTEKNELSDNDVENALLIARKIKEYGPQIVIITAGKKGVYCYFDEIKHYNTIKVDLVDVTGAGDAFSSGFLASFIRGLPLETSCQNGIKNSCSVIQSISTTKGLLHQKDLNLK